MGTRSRKEGGWLAMMEMGLHRLPIPAQGMEQVLSRLLCFYARAGAGGCCHWCRIHTRIPRHAAAAGATGARWTWDGKRGAGVDNGKRAAAAIGSAEIDEDSLVQPGPLQEACLCG